MARPSMLFFLPNTSTLLARSALNLLRGADQAELDEAIQTIVNRDVAPAAVMARLEQSVNFSEVLEKLSGEWTDETIRAFAASFAMDPAKKNVMDLIVAIAILNEPDLEAELRAENTPEATPSDLLENRTITWQYPPPGTVLNPPYVVLVAVEHVDTATADSEIRAILGELVDYKGFRIARRPTTGGARPPLVRLDPGLLNLPIRDVARPAINPALLAATRVTPVAAAEVPSAPAAPAPAAAPPSAVPTGMPGAGGAVGRFNLSSLASLSRIAVR